MAGCSTYIIFVLYFPVADHLEVTLLRAEGDIQLLQTKMEELQSARITQAKGGADRIQMLGKWSIEKTRIYSIKLSIMFILSLYVVYAKEI